VLDCRYSQLADESTERTQDPDWRARYLLPQQYVALDVGLDLCEAGERSPALRCRDERVSYGTDLAADPVRFPPACISF